MDCFVKVSSDGNALVSTAVGKLDEVSSLLMRNKIADSIKSCKAKQILLDIRLAVVAASIIDIYHVATSSLKMFPLGFKYAIVYSEETMTEEIAIFGETVARNRGGQVKVFKDISEAKKWLAVSEI